DLDEHPPSMWAPWLNHAYVDVQHARCLARFGHHSEAAQLFRQALLDVPFSFRRDRGVYLAREALAHAEANDPEQAAAVGSEALAIARETQSGRIVNELKRLELHLANWQAVRVVDDFRNTLSEILPA